MTTVILCLDGLDPAYLRATETPHWDEIASAGTTGTCQGVVPTTTNVNNVSIVTAAFPETHGITSNTYYDAEAGERAYMIDPALLQCETVFQSEIDEDDTVAALVAKQKLEDMVGRGCDVVASAESPPEWLTEAVGPAPDIYSGDASAWLVDAAVHLIDERAPDVLYVSTTDVVPHKHAPDEEPAREWVQALDAGLGAIYERGCDVIATADHGMNHKSRCLDVEAMLEAEGYPAEVIRLIRDEHTYHHQNLGGAAYVYLHEHAVDEIEWLADVDGIDAMLSREEAADRFRLGSDIGDAMLLGTEETVFGPVEDGEETTVDLRSHGSTYERDVPFVASEPVELRHNKDVFDEILG